MSQGAFGELLRRWRQARRLSQERLGEVAEVSTRHISFLETGKALLRSLAGYPGLPGRRPPDAGPPDAEVCLPLHLTRDNVELRLFTTLATLGTPVDVAAEELRIESYYPADAATERWLERGAVAPS